MEVVWVGNEAAVIISFPRVVRARWPCRCDVLPSSLAVVLADLHGVGWGAWLAFALYGWSGAAGRVGAGNEAAIHHREAWLGPRTAQVRSAS